MTSTTRLAATGAALALVASALALTPSASAGSPTPTAPASRTIEEIQGPGPASPFAGTSVVTRGVVTAAYPAGGLAGFTIVTPGSGGRVDLRTHHTSDGLFVYLGSATATSYPEIGDHVSVQGTVAEYHGLTEVSAAGGGVTRLAGSVRAPRPAAVAWPRSEAERESLESMTLAPRGRYTVTDTYDLNRYASIGLARGIGPLRQPTDVARPGPAADAVAADNAARLVTLDDGASTDFLPPGGGADQDIPLPYLSPAHPVRVGAPVSFVHPVVVDYRNGAWRLQPLRQVTAGNGATTSPVVIPDTRTRHPRPVGGDVRIASLNVLNYFTETGEDWVADGGTCSFYDDRDGNHVTTRSCNGDGPRGAADRGDLARQQAKIVAAVEALGADVLSLEEIENAAKYAGPARRDDALATLVDALNAAAGRHEWSYVPSPRRRPSVAEEDVIRTAFIYRPAQVRPVGPSRILVGDPAFADAREPLAQAFRPRHSRHAQPFLVIVNHFKSKSSGVDDGTGQGLSNPDRVAQAKALVRFAAGARRSTHTRPVFLVGDFNSYTREDPMRRLYSAGYTDLGSRFTGESTYLFGGEVGSLDHVLANRAAVRAVTGADVWNVSSVESVAFEYSRYNANATDFFSPDPFRASDHDPLLVGVRTGGH
jgi:5'-nucleotidase